MSARDRDTTDYVAKAWIDSGSLVRGIQTSFFDDFVEQSMHDVLTRVLPVSIFSGTMELRVVATKMHIWNHPRIDGSPLFPHEARGVKTISYDVPLFVQFDVELREFGEVEEKRTLTIKCADLPVMLRSSACTLKHYPRPDPSPGGFFIIRGSPRVMLPQEQLACNVLFRARDSVRIKSRGVNRVISDLAMILKRDGRVVVRHATLGTVSALLVMRAAGAQIPDHVRLRDLARVEDLPPTSEGAIALLAQKCKKLEDHAMEERISRLRSVFATGLVPHASDPRAFLTFMMHELMQCADGKRSPDDVQHAGFKRFETCDVMMSELLLVALKTFMNNVNKKIKAYVQRRDDDGRGAEALAHIVRSPEKWLRHRCMTPKIQSALATGVWPRVAVGRRGRRKVDVTEALGEKNLIDTVEHLRKTSGPGSGHSLQARSFHPTHAGFVCPFETPDKDKTGLVKYFAVGACLSRSRAIGIDPASLPRGSSRLFLNGDLVAENVDGLGVARWMRAKRRAGDVPFDVGVSYSAERDAVDVRSDAGRMLQVLLRREALETNNFQIPEVTKRYEPTLSPPAWMDPTDQDVARWESMRAVVDALDAMELNAVETPNESLVVVGVAGRTMPSNITHVHLLSASFASLVAGLAAFAGNNQVTRTAFYVSQAKQTISCPVPRLLSRGTNVTALDYPQTSLVTTNLTRWTGIGHTDSPNGINVVLAVLTDENNYEDSLVVKREFMDRGGFRMTAYHSYVCTVHETEEKLHDITAVGTFVRAQDILVSKTREMDNRDTSLRVKLLDSGYVDSVSVSSLGASTEIVVTLRLSRGVEEGDKLCMAHGQKGTVGRVVSGENLPFSLQTGTSPDILFNPHALPSRGTYGPLLESVAGKMAALTGTEVDATPWQLDASGWDVSRLEREFRALATRGYAPDGTEAFVNGATGEMMSSRVMVGVVTMRRLKQLADEKQRAISLSARDSVTRQPVRGRANMGALRFGSMEADAVLAHGAPGVLRDRLVTQCDDTTLKICSCGGVLNTPRCGVCGETGEDFRTKYSFLLAVHEMRTLGVDLRVDLGNTEGAKGAKQHHRDVGSDASTATVKKCRSGSAKMTTTP